MQPYEDALDGFVARYRGPIAFLFNTQQEHVTDKDLKSMLEYSMGLELQTIFEFKGGFGPDTLKELQKLPRKQRSSEVAQTALERAEFKQVQNKPLNRIRAAEKRRNPLAERLANWRTIQMRREMSELANTAMVVEKQTQILTLALDRYRLSPSAAHKQSVTMAVTGLNRALVRSHARARVAGAWAIRAGFHSHSAGRALDHLYFKRAKRLEKSTARLDTWLQNNGFKVRVSSGIARRRNILEIEMAKAIELDTALPMMMYPKHHRQFSLDGPNGV